MYFLLVLLLCQINTAWSEQLLPLEAYGSLPSIDMMTISPSGDSIAYRTTSSERDMVIIYNFKKKKMIGGLNVAAIRPSNIYFVNEDTLVLVAVDNTRLFGFRGRHEVSAGFSYRISENKVRQLLVPGDGIYAGQSGLGSVVGISTDGKYAYMPAWKNQGEFALMKVNLAGKRTPRSVKRGKHDAVDYFISNDIIVARELFDNDKDLHRVQSLIDGEWKEIFREETEIPRVAFVGLTADKESLVMKAYNNNRIAYYTMSLADGEVAGPLFNPKDKDVEYVIRDINRVVQGVQYSGFRPSYDFFDERLDKTVKQVMEQLPDHSVSLVDYTSDFKELIFKIEGVDTAGDFYLYRDGKFAHIASRYGDVPGDSIAQVFETKIKARDGLYIPTLLTLPNVEELKNLPGIMLPHGGPEAYDKIQFDWLAQFFASRGYLVMQPQFRGSDGFGWDFRSKGRGEWGRKMQDDLTDTVKTMVKSGYLDPERVCIVGGSYGGYAALAGAAFTPDLYKCAISFNGVSDIERMMRDDRYAAGSDHWVVAYWNKVISAGNVDENHLEDISPINHVDKIKIPVLLVHGTRDEVVSYRQSENMFDEMEDADKDVTYVELDKGDHYLSEGHHRIQALKEFDKFIKKHL